MLIILCLCFSLCFATPFVLSIMNQTQSANRTEFCDHICSSIDLNILSIRKKTAEKTFLNPGLGSINSGSINFKFYSCHLPPNQWEGDVHLMISLNGNPFDPVILILAPIQCNAGDNSYFLFPHNSDLTPDANWQHFNAKPSQLNTLVFELTSHNYTLIAIAEIELKVNGTILPPPPLAPFSPPPVSPPSVLAWMNANPWIYFIISMFIIFVVSIIYVLKKRFDNSRSRSEIQEFGDFVVGYSDLNFDEKIGVGAFAIVYKGEYKGKAVAIKKLNQKVDQKAISEFKTEAKLLRLIKHPNVVQFVGISESKSDLCLIIEYCKFGSLFIVLHKKRVAIENEHIRKFCIDICEGMIYLHSMNIIHRDLKTPNLLIDENWTIKVADFGLSRERDKHDTIQTMTACGTPAWAAPEVLGFQKYSLKADVFSFGVCLWEMVVRQIPFEKMAAAKIIIGVATSGMKLDIPQSFPEQFKTIHIQCTDNDHSNRPSFSELKTLFEEIKFPKPHMPYPYKSKVTEKSLLLQ